MIRPTLMCARPAHLREGLQPASSPAPQAAGGAKAKIFQLGGQGRQAGVALEQAGKPARPGCSSCSYGIADKLVFSKLRARLGGRIRILVSGAAPLSKEIARVLPAAGLPICEGYGLTETSAGAFVNLPDGAAASARSARPMGDLEVRIDADGEVLSCAACRSCAATTTCPRRPPPCFTDGRLLHDRRHRRARRRRLPEDHRPQEGPDQDLGRQVRRADATSRASSRRSARTSRRCVVIGQARNFCTMLRHPRPGRDRGLGRRRRRWRARPTPRSSPRRRPHAMVDGLRQGAERASSTAGRRSRSSPSCRATCPSRTASSPRR